MLCLSLVPLFFACMCNSCVCVCVFDDVVVLCVVRVWVDWVCCCLFGVFTNGFVWSLCVTKQL